MTLLDTIFRNYKDPFGYLAAQGRMYRFAPAALNTTATGGTSFATTTPTFLFAIDAGTQYAAIPAEARLFQAGTVAQGAITYLMEIDNADRYTSGGTALTATNVRMGGASLPSGIAMYDTNSSAITATDAAGHRIDGALLGQDVSPAEGAVNQIIWAPQAGPDILIPTATTGASWLINTSAATTGPTWIYSFKVAIIPLDWATQVAALGWLLNLDFASGTSAVESAAQGTYHAEVRRTRYAYDYGYRYIKQEPIRDPRLATQH